MKNKKKLILVILIVLLFIVAVTLLVLNQTGIINRIIENSKKEEIKKEITCQVYHHVNGLAKILVVAEDTENGIEKIIYPNNQMELYCNGKTKVAFDYNTDITGKESITFKMVNTKNEEIEKTIAINDQFYLDMIDHSITKETETQQALTVNYKEGSITKQYKIGEGETWIDYTNTIRLDDYQILETLGSKNRNTNIYLRQIDNIGNEIITNVKYTIDESTTYKQEDTVIEGKSILECIENNNLETGNYIFRVTGATNGKTKETIDYPVELYNYNEEANYQASNEIVVNNIKYTGIGKTNSEKRMLILKYNKSLNINQGATITPTGTTEIINGATDLCTKKGMFIYCAGTLTNNGEITMTAKGTVNQAGENVYLYKNENNTYEYIPAVGANGGVPVSGRSNGNVGGTGIERKTGGGGSGGTCIDAYNQISGSGGNGTSYSGGTGGGGSGNNKAGNGSSIGGPGGNGTTLSSVTYSGGSGAGNPGGKTIDEGRKGTSGTGGLLTVFGEKIINNGTITANGSDGGIGHTTGGGGSAGGSINLFYKTEIKRGTITVYGGSGGGFTASGWWGINRTYGGAGGTGCATIGNISTGTFVKD